MDKILKELFNVINGDLSDMVSNVFTDLVNIALKIEDSAISFTKAINVDAIYNVLFGYGIALIILKFLKKGFDTYILWNDGDTDANPLQLMTNFFKALAVAISFPIMYEWIIKIIIELINALQTYFSNSLTIGIDPGRIVASRFLTSTLWTISLVLMLIFIIKFIGQGIEIMILRVGFPLACVGLIDSDGGIFKNYFSKLIQALCAVLVQILIVHLGVEVIFAKQDFILGFAILLVALRTPKFLQEFMVTAGGGGGRGLSSAVSGTVNVVHMFKRFKG